MRIIGGEWRGRKLVDIGEGDADAHLRPTSDRTRETLFNMLSHPRYGGTPKGANVLDVFAGTGALGLEALSRGAASASFIETGKTSLNILRQNIKTLGAKADILTHDARKLPAHSGTKFDLVFLDPPYNQGLGEEAIEQLIQGDYLNPNAIIIWEEERAPRPPATFMRLDARKIGRAIITFYRFEEK